MTYLPHQDAVTQPKTRRAVARGGLAVVVTLIGTFGIGGCTAQPAANPSSSTSTATKQPSAPDSSLPTPPPIVYQFINAVNDGNATEANDLLCPKVLGVSPSYIQKAIAGSARLEVDPDPSHSGLHSTGLVGTYDNSELIGSSVGFSDFTEQLDDGKPCISLFAFYN